MKILITNTGPWGTGSFTVVRALTQEFLKMGHQVKVFFPDAGYPCADSEIYYKNPDLWHIWKFPISRNGITLESFPLIIPDPHPRNDIGTTFLQLTEEELKFYLDEFRKEITKVIDDFKPDAIECQHIWAFDHVIDQMRLPFFTVAHHSDQLGFRYDNRMQPLTVRAANHAKKIFAISKQVHEEVVELYGVDPSKIVITNNGYDRSVFKPCLVDKAAFFKEFNLDIPENATIVTMAGKISKTKGVDIMLEANRLLNPALNVHFIVLGAGKLEKILDPSHPNRYRLDRVHFLGHQGASVLARAHNIAHFSMMPSRSEGFGIACLEAMGCGLPVIVTRAGGPEEYAVGEIIDREDPQQLAMAIEKMATLGDHDLNELKERALQTALQFSWEAIAKERILYYEGAA